MSIDIKVAQAVVDLRTNPNFQTVVNQLAKRGEDNTKKAIYTDGHAGDIAKGMARESIEVLKGIEKSVSIIEGKKTEE